MNHRPRKRFGQNFLRDRNMIDHIVGAVAVAPDDHIVEIGPGQGALTGALLRRAVRLDAIEIDRDLANQLLREFADDKRFVLHETDALQFDFSTLPGNAPLRVVGNLPYNISTPLIFHLLKFSARIRDMHFMLQREVVDRLAAEPGSKQYGRLSVMAQHTCDVEKLFDVPPEAFVPRPKVMSAVVRLAPKSGIQLGELEQHLAVITRDAFGQRRKTLRNSLRNHINPEQLETLEVSPDARAEQLSVADFVRISNFVAGH